MTALDSRRRVTPKTPGRRWIHGMNWPWFLALALPVLVGAQTTLSPEHRHAWAGNIGWTDWVANGANGARVGEYVCSGYLYAANVGWIHLGDGSPANGIRYQNQSGTDYGVNRDPEGRLSGLAYGANIGWLTFTNRSASGTAFGAPQVDLRTGRFSGFVYGANVGWISLSNAVAHLQTTALVPGTDSDHDGLADGWELSHVASLAVMNGITDLDQDGATDLNEYGAHTDPLDAIDRLEITRFEVDPDDSTVEVSWSSRSTRDYSIQIRSTVDAATPWTDSGLGVLVPDPGATTTRRLSWPDPEMAILRVEAQAPLQPED